MKIGFCLILFAILMVVAGGIFATGIMLIAFSSAALQKAEEIPSWIQHLLIPIVAVTLFIGVLLPPAMFYLGHSWASVGVIALASFSSACLTFFIAGFSILPDQ